jgi:hypothetical protein
MNVNKDYKVDPVLSESVHEELFGKQSSHMNIHNRISKVRSAETSDMSNVEPSRSFGSDSSCAKDSYPSFHDDSKNVPALYVNRNEPNYSTKAEETKDFAEVMKMVEKIQYLTEGFSVIAQNESMDIASFKCTSTINEDRSASIGSATPSTISLRAMLKETQELRIAAVSMAKKLKKRKGILHRSSRSLVLGSEPTKRDLATAELERLVTSLEKISLEVEGTIHKIVEGRDGEEIDSTTSSIPPLKGLEQLLQAETRDSVNVERNDNQTRELAPPLDREYYHFSSLESFSVDTNLDQEVKVTNMALLDPSITEVNDRLCPSPALKSVASEKAKDHIPLDDKGLEQVKCTSVKSFESSPSQPPCRSDSPSPLSSVFSNDEQSKRSNKSTLSPIRPYSPLEPSSHRSIPSHQLEDYYSIVVIKDLDSGLGSNGMNLTGVSNNDLRICSSESNISLREQAKPLSVRSLSAEGKLSSSQSITSMAHSVQKQKEESSITRDNAKRKTYHTIISSILDDVPKSHETDANSDSEDNVDKEVNVNATANALDNRSTIGEQGDNFPTLTKFDAISQEFDYRDKYAVEHDSRNITMISPLVEKAERGTPFMETTVTHTKAVIQANEGASSVSPASQISKKTSSPTLPMNNPNIELDVINPISSNSSKADSSKRSRFSIMSGDKPFWSRILRNKHVSSSKDHTKRITSSSSSPINQQQSQENPRMLAEKRKKKVKMDIWNMIRGNKPRNPKQKNKSSMDRKTEINEIPGNVAATLLPADERRDPVPNETTEDMPRLIDEDLNENNLQMALDELDLLASNHSKTSANTNPITQPTTTVNKETVKVCDPRDDQSAEDDFGLIITITHDSDCEGIETSMSESIDPYKGVEVEMNESYLLSKDKKVLVSSEDDNSFPSLLYPYLDPKRIGSKGRAQNHSTFFRHRPSYVLEKSASGSIDSRNPSKYGVDKFSFLEPPEVPSKSIFDTDRE